MKDAPHDGDVSPDTNSLRRRVFASGGLAILGSLFVPDTHAERASAGAHATLESLRVPGFVHRYVEVNGLRHHYVRAGQGPALLLLHGWPFSWYTWHAVIPDLAKRFTVIAPDVRGIGLSGKPLGGYDAVSLAADAAALLRHEGVTSAAVVGHDLGVSIAYQLAARYPGLVSKLVLTESIILGGPDAELFMSTPPWWVAFHTVRVLPESLLIGKEGRYLDWFYTNLSHESKGISKVSRDAQVRAYTGLDALRGGFEQYRAFELTTRQGLELRGTRLPMPVLALGGDLVRDVLFRQAKGIADHVQGGVIDRCGHIIQEERPQELLSRLFGFL